jgi:threonine 3-dehydrogenase
MAPPPVALITGANGEIGRSLLERLHAEGRYRVVTLDLTPLPDRFRPTVPESYAGNILDRNLLDQIAAHHEIERGVPPRGAALHPRRARPRAGAPDQRRGHAAPAAHGADSRPQRAWGEPVRFIFPSVHRGVRPADLEAKAAQAGARGAAPRAHHHVRLQQAVLRAPRPVLHPALPLGGRGRPAPAARLPRAALPGAHLRRHGPSGGTSDFGPEMLHAAAQGKPYACFVGPEARIPFMAMPDACAPC